MLTYTSCGPVINVQGAQKTFEQLIPLQRNTLVVVLYIFHAMWCDTICLLHFSFHFRSMYILWFYCQFSRESSTIKASRKLKKTKSTHHSIISRIFYSSINHGCASFSYFIACFFLSVHTILFKSHLNYLWLCNFADKTVLANERQRAHNLWFINLLFSKHKLWHFEVRLQHYLNQAAIILSKS